MNLIDIAVLVLAAYYGFKGFRAGLIRIVFDLIAISGGLLVSIRYYPQLARELVNSSPLSPVYASVLSFMLIWGGVFLVLIALGYVINKGFSFSIFAPVNFLGGAILGGIKGVLIAVPFLLPLIYFNWGPLENSHVIRYLDPASRYIYDHYIPTSFKQDYLGEPKDMPEDENLDRIREILKQYE